MSKSSATRPSPLSSWTGTAPTRCVSPWSCCRRRDRTLSSTRRTSRRVAISPTRLERDASGADEHDARRLDTALGLRGASGGASTAARRVRGRRGAPVAGGIRPVAAGRCAGRAAARGSLDPAHVERHRARRRLGAGRLACQRGGDAAVPLFWDDYCAWYLESIKPRIYGDDADSSRTAHAVALVLLASSVQAPQSVHAIPGGRAVEPHPGHVGTGARRVLPARAGALRAPDATDASPW